MGMHLKFILGAIVALILMLAGVALCVFYNAPASYLQRILSVILLGFAAFVGFLLGRESAKQGMWPPRDKTAAGADLDIGS